MALRVLQYAATIPAGTAKGSPVTIPLGLENWELLAIDLEVPPGPAGLMGFYVANNGVQWLPQPAGSWLVWDDYRDTWPLQGQPNAGGWAVVGYNTGVYPHTVTVRAHVNTPTVVAVVKPEVSLTFLSTEAPAKEPVTL